SSHVISVQVVPDLGQRWGRRLVLPRKDGIASRARIRSVDVLIELSPLGCLPLTEVVPSREGISDLTTKLVLDNDIVWLEYFSHYLVPLFRLARSRSLMRALGLLLLARASAFWSRLLRISYRPFVSVLWPVAFA